jgi:hypothetical protein
MLVFGNGDRALAVRGHTKRVAFGGPVIKGGGVGRDLEKTEKAMLSPSSLNEKKRGGKSRRKQGGSDLLGYPRSRRRFVPICNALENRNSRPSGYRETRGSRQTLLWGRRLFALSSLSAIA